MKRGFRPLLVAFFTLAFAAAAFAQTPTGIISGRVTDPQGAAVVGATVKITEKGTNREIVTTTNGEGLYEARNLPPGPYNVRVEQAGFSTAAVENVIVQISQVSTTDIGLTVGNVSDVVTVQGTEAQLTVDTIRQTVDGVITARQIQQLPLDQRNFLDLAQLQPSVQVRDGESIDPTKSNAYRAVTVNGSSGTGTRVQIDGIDVTDETVGTTLANISTDAVQEFNLQRSSFDPSTSLTTSGSISILSRSGTNEYHGSGFYFFRNQDLGARVEFEPEELPFKRQQQGFRFGGPIKKDKLFFFLNYESTYETEQNTFSSIDFGQFNGSIGLPTEARYTTARVDYALNDSTRLFYRHSYDDNLSTGGTGINPFQNVNWTNVHVVGADITGSSLTHSIRFGYVNFNNRIQSQELGGFEFLRTSTGTPFELFAGDLTIGPNSLAPQQTYQDNYQTKYDGSWTRGNHTFRYGGEINRIILGGFANFAGPLAITVDVTPETIGELPAGQRSDPLNYPVVDFTTGPDAGFFTAVPAHDLPFGGKRNTRLGWYFQDSWKVRPNFTLNLGVRHNYESNFFEESAPSLPAIARYGGTEFAQVAEFPKTAFSPVVGFAWDPKGNGRTSIRGGYQLNYEMNIFNNALFDSFQRLPPGIGPDVAAASSGLIVGPTGQPIDVGGFPDGDYTGLFGRPLRDVLPIINAVNTALKAAYANHTFDPNGGTPAFVNSRGITFGYLFPGDYRIPYSHNWNIGVQRELFDSHVLSVDYVRTFGIGLPYLGVDLERRRAANTLDPAAALARLPSRLALLGVGSVQELIDAGGTIDDLAAVGLFNDTVLRGATGTDITRARIHQGGFSKYNALQVKFDGRLSEGNRFTVGGHDLLRGANYTVSYTLSRAEATNGSGRTEFLNRAANNDDPNSFFGPTTNDRTHIFSAGINTEVIGGFQLNQIHLFRTGAPQSLYLPATSFLTSELLTIDINGDGVTNGLNGAPSDLLPGTEVGDLNRRITNYRQLNEIIRNFNTNFAGRFTPLGQRLVDTGVFTAAQLRALNGVIQPIAEVPEGNPFPDDKFYNLDLRIARPIRWGRDGRFELIPSLDLFNVFNNNSLGNVGFNGLDASAGALNGDYSTDRQRGDLAQFRGRQKQTRRMQFGIRFNF
jgi:hypothetical protein